MFFRVHFLGEGGMGDNTEGALSELLLENSSNNISYLYSPRKIKGLGSFVLEKCNFHHLCCAFHYGFIKNLQLWLSLAAMMSLKYVCCLDKPPCKACLCLPRRAARGTAHPLGKFMRKLLFRALAKSLTFVLPFGLPLSRERT